MRAIDLLQQTPMAPMDGQALTACITALCACGRYKRAEAMMKGFTAASGAALPMRQSRACLAASLAARPWACLD